MALNNKTRRAAIAALVFALSWSTASGGPIRERIAERRAAQENNAGQDDAEAAGRLSLPANIRIRRNVAYGGDGRQRFDVYSPLQAGGAPVIFMVHGGGWGAGDKAERAMVENKVARWVPRGYILISVNYRMLPDVDPVEQAGDIALALAAAQDNAASFGGDRNKFVLMGHSAGAHLVALLAASPASTSRWRGAVLLDTAALDVVDLMRLPHAELYDRAFGGDSAYWRAASPYHALTQARPPVLAVCSTRHAHSCQQAARFVAKAKTLGMQASVLKQDLSHGEVNLRLGEEGSYTDAVEWFLRSLDVSVPTGR